MGRKGGWFSAVRKALSPQSKEKKDQKSKAKKKWSAENKNEDLVTPSEPVMVAAAHAAPPMPPPPPPAEETKLAEVDIEDEQNKHAYSVAIATAAAAEAAVAAAQAAAEVVRLTTAPRFAGKSKEEVATLKIQTAFRGYLARRALRALRGLVRLKSLIEGQSVKRQAATTLRCMQTLARVQSQIRSRRIRMQEENQALQRQLQQKHEIEIEKLKIVETWDDSVQSKEQIEASLLSKQEAAMRRERALAYSYSHQQTRKNSKYSNPTFMDPNNPHWGWSWLERWMAARPWESRSMPEKEFNDHGSVKSFRTLSVAGELNRAYGLRGLSLDNNKPSPTGQRQGRPASRQSPSNAARPSSVTPGSGKAKPNGQIGNGWGLDDDTKSMMSIQSERHRRHSIAGSSVGDDESLASSPSVPSYMAPTKSAKARTKAPSPLGPDEKNGIPDQNPLPMGSAKKRLSFSPGGHRRHSVPGKLESAPMKNAPMHTVEVLISNGGSR